MSKQSTSRIKTIDGTMFHLLSPVRYLLFCTMMGLAALMMGCSSAVFSTKVIFTETPVASSTAAVPSATSTPLPPSETPVPTLGIGSTQIRSADDAVMMYIPDGEFIMGSNDGSAAEGPEHKVHLIDYWIDRTEVTNNMYEKCIDAKVCYNPGTSKSSDEYDDFPVVQMHWADAQAYCAWVDARLPTEAEWEKAARGTDGRAYSWGNELDPTKYYLNPKPSGTTRTIHQAVGSYPQGASPYGVLDMTGGVFEWVKDMFSSDYYADSPYSNPIGPTDGSDSHFYRGGSYVDYDVRVFRRSLPDTTSHDPDWIQFFNVGFRCAMDTDY